MLKGNQKLLKIWYFISTGFGIGNVIIIFPGTVGSLLAIPIWWSIVYFFSYQIYIIFLMLSMVMGVYICDQAVKFVGIHDHKSIVWDELVGMWVALIIVPIHSFIWMVITFFIFRILDILKPWPIFYLDHNIQGGIGIMIDDIMASVMSICVVLLLMHML